MTGRSTSRSDPNDPEVARALESFDVRDAMIAGLAAGANDLASAARNLIGAARLTRLEKTVAVSLLVLNAVIGFGVALLVIVTLGVATDNREAREQSAIRLRDALTYVLNTQVAVTMCDRDLPSGSPEEFQTCVRQRLTTVRVGG